MSAQRRGVIAGVALAGCLGMGLMYQNCSRVSIADSATHLNALAVPYLNVSDIYLTTQVNKALTTPVSIAVQNASVSLSQTSELKTLAIDNGVVTVSDDFTSLTFTPTFGFRGTTAVTIYSTYGTTTNVQHITYTVENPKLNYNPALAVRAPECVMCHANIQGDMITDFGYKSASDTGPDLMFKYGPNPGISPYSFAHSGTDSFDTATIAGKLAIPKVLMSSLDTTIGRAYFPSAPTSAQTLKQYVDTVQSPIGSAYQGSFELSSVYIGAPTVTDILTHSQMASNEVTKFYKNTPDAPALSGFGHISQNGFDYFGNTKGQPLICEGDLFVDGVVFLDHVTIQTSEGCRIYATHSVFINGPVSYLNELALSNVEVTSAVGIYMGFGYCVDCADSVTFGYRGYSTLKTRWNTIATYLPRLRSRSVADHVADIDADFAKVSNLPTSVPTGDYANTLAAANVNLLDASNSFINEGTVTFDRLLLNAPDVQSRYLGDFQGIVIAEFAMWRLGQFQFSFEPVFTGVPLFPFLDFSKILSIQK